MFIQGCQLFYEPDTSPPAPVETPPEEFPPPVEPPVSQPTRRGRFTLRYDSKSSLNPITALNRDNILLGSLMYESLFVLDDKMTAEPVLCESWETEDNVTFIFTLLPNIAMSDGTWLTADDVVYTLRQSMQKGRFVNRFGSVASIASDGGLAVTIVLRSPNSRFMNLLDVPIIKSGSIDSQLPPGTGPYVFADPESMQLQRFTRYRDYFDLPVSFVYLIECADDELTQFFDDGHISLLWDDPSDAFEIRLNRLYDPRLYDTTTMQFIGFNGRLSVLRDPDVRRAIGCAVEREFIVSELMPAGHALAAPLPLSPAFSQYNTAWEYSEYEPFEEMALLLKRAGLSDYDDDSFLEIWDGYGGYEKFSIIFIVNSENLHRVRVAQRIADTLRRAGLDIIVRELPWDSYISALENGNFGMYYGEIMLGADFDLSPLLLPGKLNYGGMANTTYKPFIDDFLYAKTDFEVNYAANRLLEEIKSKSPFIPILYKRHVIYSPMGAVTGVSPSQSNVFRNITEWTINLTMLT